MLPTMVQNYHKESLAKFPLPSHPDKENYVTTMEYDEAMKEYCDDWATTQALHKCWIRWEQVEDMHCSADVARVQAEADRLCVRPLSELRSRFGSSPQAMNQPGAAGAAW